ncbi:MAG: hypothetical protein H7Z12_13260 [Rhodospirillaceae bacterium]|nr:hypothetical protein [Rhodospirillales bacterium]
MDDGATKVAGGLLAEIAQLLAKGDIDVATQRAEAAMGEPSQQLTGICALAAIYYRVGALANAIKLLADVVDHKDAPKDIAEVLAVLYCLAGQVSDALYCGKVSAGMDADGELLALFGEDFPKFVDAFSSIGYKPLMTRATALASLGDIDRALLMLKQHLLLNPTDVEALDRYAQTMVLAGDIHGAVGMLRSVATLAGPTATILSRLGQCLTLLGDLAQGEACHSGAVARSPASPVILSAMLSDMRYQDADLPVTARLAAQWSAAIAAAGPKTVRAAPTYVSGEKIRIAYLCTGHHHADVTAMLAQIAQGHNREKFTVVGLGAGEVDDARNAWSRGVFDSWRDVGALDVATLSAVVRGEGINVLVDMDGLIAPDKEGLFLRNAAPLQIAWLNTPPVGRVPGNHLQCVSGAGESAPGEMRLPYGRWFLGTKGVAAEPIGPAPVVANGTVTFGCELSAAQMTPRVVMAFGRILQAVPNATLVLRDTGSFADPTSVERLIDLFGNAAVAHRVDIVQGESRAEFARAIDVALAPFPVGDVLCCGEFLGLGVPVVVAANNADGRDVAAALASVGLSDLAGADVDAYVAIASGLGQDVARLSALRADIPARLAASPAFSARGFMTAFEAVINDALTGISA